MAGWFHDADVSTGFHDELSSYRHSASHPFLPSAPACTELEAAHAEVPALRRALRGVLEILREPPTRRHISRAVRCMRSLKACYHPSNTLQYHRILWTKAWLDALDDQDYSEADTDDDA